MKTVQNALEESGWPTSKIAAALGESKQAVHNWHRRGYPADKCKALEALTGISVRLLRPDDWQKYWPDAPEPSPEVPQQEAA